MPEAIEDRLSAFVDAYVEHHAWKDKRDPETCRENAQKYATSLRGTSARMGWFDFLRERREKSPEDATAGDVRGFLLYLEEEGLSGPTRMQARSAISQYYQLMDVGTANPVADLDGSWSVTTNKEDATGEKRNHPSREDIQAMIDNAPEPTLRSTLIIKLLYQTGCRRMELATMQADKIDIEGREIRVYADKTDGWRTVTFRESLRQPLNIWLSGPRQDEPGYHEDNPYLFPSLRTRETDTDHISGETIRKTVHEAAQNAGVQDTYGDGDVNGQRQWKITPHALRHAFAVHSAENGVPAPHLKKIMGHTKLDITQIYADIAEDDAAEMMKNRGPSLGD